MQNVPRGAFCTTFDLHLASICRKDLCFYPFLSGRLIKTGFGNVAFLNFVKG